jgi:hypothetical protein
MKRIEPSEALYAEIYETFVGLTEWFALSYKDWRKDIDELREVLECCHPT